MECSTVGRVSGEDGKGGTQVVIMYYRRRPLRFFVGRCFVERLVGQKTSISKR